MSTPSAARTATVNQPRCGRMNDSVQYMTAAAAIARRIGFQLILTGSQRRAPSPNVSKIAGVADGGGHGRAHDPPQRHQDEVREDVDRRRNAHREHHGRAAAVDHEARPDDRGRPVDHHAGDDPTQHPARQRRTSRTPATTSRSGPTAATPATIGGRDQHVVDQRLAGEVRRLLGALFVEQLHVDRHQRLPHGADEDRLHVLAQVVGRRIQTNLRLAFDARKVPLMT